MSTEMIIMMIGLGLGGHFQKALDESGKEAELAELGILPKSGIS